MKLIEQSWEWANPDTPICGEDILQQIEKAGRTCYKSEALITPDSAKEFVKMIIHRGHESVLEHAYASVRFITNRGVTHELVRHRICGYSQESTRYVKYDGSMEFIKPVWWDRDNWGSRQKDIFVGALLEAEKAYQELLHSKVPPQEAREVLPNALKTEIVVTSNLREWRHIFKMRCSMAAHPQIRDLMISCLNGFRKVIPVVFDDEFERG